MNMSFLIFIASFLTVYSTANYYVGLRGWQAFHRLPAFPGGRFYSVAFILVAFGYIFERFVGNYLPDWLNCLLAIVGGTWMAVVYYAVFFCLLVDTVRLADRVVPFVPNRVKKSPAGVGLLGIVLVGCIILYGIWNANQTVWRSYEITIDKPAGDRTEMRVVMVSDIHLGKVIGNSRLQYLVAEINARKPDLVLLAGDVFDEDIGHFITQDMGATFRRLNARYGVYAVLGNHEYIGRETEAAIALLHTGGVKVLRDSYEVIEQKLVVAGRDDWDRLRFTGTVRKPLDQFLQGVNRSLPLILMDHQPRNYEEARQAGVDLILSGHSHRGQLFPNYLVTSRMYELDWGYLRKQSLQAIVSSGFGTWGPPVRTGSSSEIVEINLKFRQTQGK